MAGFNPKDYVDVQTRILQFWKDHPGGAIRTRLMSDPSDFTTCRYVAEVFKEAANTSPDATGYAFEIAGTGMANKTSHEENCETSAIGRALANMGYATSGKDRPSREEMSKASAPVQRKQTPPRGNQTPAKGTSKPTNVMDATVTQAGLKKLHAVLADYGLTHDHLTAYAIDQGHESSKQLTNGQGKKLVDGLEKNTDAAVKYLQTLANKMELEQVGMEVGQMADQQGVGK